MPTAGESKALWFFALVALSGGGVRLWRSTSLPANPPPVALERQLRRVDSARENPRSRKARKARTRVDSAVSPASPIDLDRASAREIEALPGIGPALAGRIVSNRDSAGAFGSIDGLCEVRGVGPALAKRLRPLVTFSGARRPLSVGCSDGSRSSRKGRAARHSKQR